MSKVNETFSAIDCETYFSEGGCGANFVLNIYLGGGASDIVNASSDYETGEVRCYIILLQNNRQIGSHATKSWNRWRYGKPQLFFNITLEPISFLYLYHLIYVNKLRYQAFESKNGVGMEPSIQLLRYPFCVTKGKSSVRDEYYKSSTFRGCKRTPHSSKKVAQSER